MATMSPHSLGRVLTINPSISLAQEGDAGRMSRRPSAQGGRSPSESSQESTGSRSPWPFRRGRGSSIFVPPAPRAPDTSNLPLNFSRKDLKPKGWDRIVIHPDNRVKSYFESFIVVCVLYTAILEPIKVTYMLDINPEVDVFLDIIFFVDLGIQFISGCAHLLELKPH